MVTFIGSCSLRSSGTIHHRHLEVHQDDIIMAAVHGVRVTALLHIQLLLHRQRGLVLRDGFRSIAGLQYESIQA